MINNCNTCNLVEVPSCGGCGCQCDCTGIQEEIIPCGCCEPFTPIACERVCCKPCWDTCMCMELILKLQYCAAGMKKALTQLDNRLTNDERVIESNYNYLCRTLDNMNDEFNRLIDEERDAREDADRDLLDRIIKEEGDRAHEDQLIRNLIEAETTARENADDAILLQFNDYKTYNNTRVSRIEEDVQNLKVRMLNVEGDVTNIKNDINNIKSDINNIKNDIINLRQLIQNISNTLNNYITNNNAAMDTAIVNISKSGDTLIATRYDNTTLPGITIPDCLWQEGSGNTIVAKNGKSVTGAGFYDSTIAQANS